MLTFTLRSVDVRPTQITRNLRSPHSLAGCYRDISKLQVIFPLFFLISENFLLSALSLALLVCTFIPLPGSVVYESDAVQDFSLRDFIFVRSTASSCWTHSDFLRLTFRGSSNNMEIFCLGTYRKL